SLTGHHRGEGGIDDTKDGQNQSEDGKNTSSHGTSACLHTPTNHNTTQLKWIMVTLRTVQAVSSPLA
ncbi:hypothetical protein, partial [Klebsiella pneumoniae]|uniref:hypothetical protein n=1 Tax=Klebsiella pneumoniae TaxID=573 RepID=UPI003B58B5F7